MLELIFLGAIAAFLITRLFQVLGTRTGNERQDLAQAMSEYLEEASKEVDDITESAPDIILDNPKLEQVVQSIKVIDPDFRVDWFLEGASNAFEVILSAFASEKTDVLKKLMEDEVYASFEKEIRKRQEKHKTLEITLVKLEPPKILSIDLDSYGEARIEVGFLSEQTNIIKDKSGSIIEGSPNQIEEITDKWIFVKNLHEKDSSVWLLSEIS